MDLKLLVLLGILLSACSFISLIDSSTNFEFLRAEELFLNFAFEGIESRFYECHTLFRLLLSFFPEKKGVF